MVPLNKTIVRGIFGKVMSNVHAFHLIPNGTLCRVYRRPPFDRGFLVAYITANGWLATASHMLTYSFDQATFACPHFSTNQVEMITQETNPVYWACTHCLTLEPWTVIISTFILVVQFDNTIRFATLESVRPGLTAKGSFKNSKSKGRNLYSSLM